MALLVQKRPCGRLVEAFQDPVDRLAGYALLPSDAPVQLLDAVAAQSDVESTIARRSSSLWFPLRARERRPS